MSLRTHAALIAAVTASGCLATEVDLAETDEMLASATRQTWLANGGFESGSSPWTFAGGAWRGTEAQTGTYQRSGTAYAVLGGHDFMTASSIAQNVAIPSSATSAMLSFYLDIVSAEPVQFPRDKLVVRITDRATGALVHVPWTYTSALQSEDFGGYATHVELDLLPCRGKQLRLELVVTTDSREPTYFIVDDASLTGTVDQVIAGE